MRALIKSGLWVVFALFTIVTFTLWWLHIEWMEPYFGAHSKQRFVRIPPGTTSSEIAALLHDAGVIRHALPWILHMRWTEHASKLKAGEYLFDSPASPQQIALRMTHGDVYYRAVTIPEGLTLTETLSLLSEQGLAEPAALHAATLRHDWIADLVPAATSLEGFLFPETYHFANSVTADEIVQSMLEQFRNQFTDIVRANPVPEGWSVADIVTLASLIEKETGIESERGTVASVFANRLRKRIPLACDPTIIYALKLQGRFDGNLRKSDLRMDSPYNTYTRVGLPPGPIANPGANSLRAALSPERTGYLYFVSRNDGTHKFSSNLRDHSRAVDRFQKRPRNR